MLLNGIKRGHEGCVRDRVRRVSRSSRGRFMNGGWETLAQEMRNYITSDTGDLRPPSIPSTHQQTHTASSTLVVGRGFEFWGQG